MEPNSIALVPSAPPSFRNNDAEYLYRQNSDFFYLTGFAEEHALLALIPGRKQGEVVLFCQEKNKEKGLRNKFRLLEEYTPDSHFTLSSVTVIVIVNVKIRLPS